MGFLYRWSIRTNSQPCGSVDSFEFYVPAKVSIYTFVINKMEFTIYHACSKILLKSLGNTDLWILSWRRPLEGENIYTAQG